ncbi:hypothetical protein PR048_017861 [Dryococelus australis]|uniref:Uncharacterized protein n=1 Tax=Dryococelus australis TaxID=614101 RepID=A0ABQ9HAV2_9NEOP|nr:hypothetical protein PR048_017861 [Dryococelus australis]
MTAKHRTALQSGRASDQFTKFVTVVNSDTLAAFHAQKDRLDTIYAGILCGEDEFKYSGLAVKITLILSHSNAFVESGFSINKYMLVGNLYEESLIGVRRVWDGIGNAGGENAIQVDQEMIRYARGAASKNKGALEPKCQNEDTDKKMDRYCKEKKNGRLQKYKNYYIRKLK